MSSLSATAKFSPLLLGILLPAASAWGGWTAFGEPAPGNSTLVWLNQPAQPARVPAAMSLDPGLRLPEVRSAVVADGSPRFRIQSEGEFILEVFIQLSPDADSDLVLESAGKLLDARLLAAPLRMYPGAKRRRTWTLSGVVRGGEEFQIRSTYPEFLLLAARWTPRREFERAVSPTLAERIRQMSADPFFEGLNQSRAARLRQLGDLALHSNQPAIRRQGLLGAARGAYWQAAENHEPRDIRLAGQLLGQALAEWPANTVVRQMASSSCAGRDTGVARGMPCTPALRTVTGVPWEASDMTDLSGAPRWAAAQWRLRARVEEITRYWVRERQRPNGELAGGWGDDVEILRQWGPIALGLGSAVAEEGIRRVALGVWNSGILKDGYNAAIEDVEHAAEPSSDTLPLLAAIAPFEEDAARKLEIAAACAANWIAPQPDGHWRFLSSWFNCARHDPSPQRAVDVHLNTRAMGPALWRAWLTRDPKLIALIARWGQSWLAAMRSTAHGKPAGMIPAAVRSSDGGCLLGATWDKPGIEWDYYQWSRGSQESIAHLFLSLHELTGDAKWRDAVREAFAAIDLAPPEVPDLDEDALTRRLSAEMEQAESRLARDFDMYTREAIYTDRVYYPLPALLTTRLFGGGPPRGDRAPDFAVTWPPAPSRFARLVTASGPTALRALLFSFDDTPGEATLRLWRLKPGAYRWSAGSASGQFSIAKLPADLNVPLPPRAQLRLIVEPATR